jgi:hypothetical protein
MRLSAPTPWFLICLPRCVRYGEPPRPDCHPNGYLNEHYNCTCWDSRLYKGSACKESCVEASLSCIVSFHSFSIYIGLIP